jgi:integrating conjugative element protein (TIGR03765 family)
MKRLPVLLAVLGGLSAPAFAAELIVVEVRGGASARPYYEVLDSSVERATPPAPQAIPRIPRSLAETEESLLPVRSRRLSPGEEPPRAIRAPGFAPIFLVGDDELSRVWLARHSAELRDLRAIGFAVNVSSSESLARLRRLVPDLTLSPVSGDDLAERLGLSHYPALIEGRRAENGRQSRIQ